MSSSPKKNSSMINNAYRAAKNAGLVRSAPIRGRANRHPYEVAKTPLELSVNPGTKQGATFWATRLGVKISSRNTTFGSGKEVLPVLNRNGSYTVYDLKTRAPMRLLVSPVLPLHTLMRNTSLRGIRSRVVTYDEKFGVMGSVFWKNSQNARKLSPIRPKSPPKPTKNPGLALRMKDARKLILDISKKNGPVAPVRTWRTAHMFRKQQRVLRALNGPKSPRPTGSLSMAQQLERYKNYMRPTLMKQTRRGSRQSRKKKN